MKLVNRVELKLENNDKCVFSCESDTPLGSIYDYACALKAFVVEKIQALEAEKKQPDVQVISAESKE